jgi:transcriptional regulator with XRE-family HTH domain
MHDNKRELSSRGEYIQKIVGRNIRDTRMRMNMTQAQLAKKCKLSPSFITEIENGRKYPSAYTLHQLSEILKLRPYQFFFSDDDRRDFDKSTLLDKLDRDLEENVSFIIKETVKRYSEK